MMDRGWRLVSLLIFASVFLFTPNMVNAEEKVTIGAVEEVILLPWGVRLPARIDTGAAKSSLDARELVTQDGLAEFKLPQEFGGTQLRLPIIEWKQVRSSDGRQKRPVVELEICVGAKRIRGKVNLTDRSLVEYPLILGRNFLRGNFDVDVKRRMTAPPRCHDIP